LEDIYQFAFVLLSSIGGAAVIIAAISSWLAKVWASKILESDKARYTQELDKIRHQFSIDLKSSWIGYVHIRYHVKVKAEANPFLPEYDKYFCNRTK